MQVFLPHSRIAVDVRPPGGSEEMLLREAVGLDRTVAVELLQRLTTVPDVLALTVYEFEKLLLHVRQIVLGDRVMAEAVCDCGQPVDIDFRISDYLNHRIPREDRTLAPGKEPLWFALPESGIEFRLPTTGDQMEVAAETDPVRALIQRCVRPAEGAGPIRRYMELLAPLMSGPLKGFCPHCKKTTRVLFDVPSFVLRELGAQVSLIYEDIHLLASHYHWSEERILGLPRMRRMEYVEMVRAERY